jgi:hypothetical protein
MSDLVWPLRPFPIRSEHTRAKRVQDRKTALACQPEEPGYVYSSSVLIRQLSHAGVTCFLAVPVYLLRSGHEKQTHFVPSHSWDGDHPRFECAQQLWMSCSLLLSHLIFLSHFFPYDRFPPFFAVFRFLCSAPSADLISSSNLVGGTHQVRSHSLPQWRVRRFGGGAVGVRDGASGVDAPSGYTSQERSQEVRQPPQS